MGVQDGSDLGEASVDLRVQRGFRRWALLRRDRMVVEINHHDVVRAQASLVATGNGDRDQVVSQAHGKIAAGGRRPAQRRQFARIVGNALRLAFELGAVKGQGADGISPRG